MIIDQIKNWEVYFKGDWVKKAFEFYQKIDDSTPDGEYEIINQDLFCKILTYDTKTEDWITESHKIYTDIQILLFGEEVINIFPSNELSVKTAYNEDTDCIFYKLPKQKPLTSFYLTPGVMGVFHPQDAHTTQIAPNNSQMIRKVVFKVNQNLFK